MSSASLAFLLAVVPTRAWASVITFNDLGAFQATAATLTLINFDTTPAGAAISHGTQIANTYASLGVTFPVGNVIESGFGGPVTSPNGWLNDTVDNSARLFTADFTTPIFAVGVHNVFNAGIPNGSTLLAFSAGHVLEGSVLSDNLADTLDFFGLISTVGITSIEVRVAGATGWGLDNLYVGDASAPVPEPATLSLLGVGLAGAAVRRFRKRT